MRWRGHAGGQGTPRIMGQVARGFSDLGQRWGSVAESVGSVVQRAEKPEDRHMRKQLTQDRMEADVAGRECCTRHVGSKTRAKAGEIMDG